MQVVTEAGILLGKSLSELGDMHGGRKTESSNPIGREGQEPQDNRSRQPIISGIKLLISITEAIKQRAQM